MKKSERYAEIGRELVADVGATVLFHRTSLSGRAMVKRKIIAGPWPTTTRRRLYIIAHECGHIFHDHRRQSPAYVQEFEAEMYAREALMQFDIEPVEKDIENGDLYIMRKLVQASRRGLKSVDGRVWRHLRMDRFGDEQTALAILRERGRSYSSWDFARFLSGASPMDDEESVLWEVS